MSSRTFIALGTAMLALPAFVLFLTLPTPLAVLAITGAVFVLYGSVTAAIDRDRRDAARAAEPSESLVDCAHCGSLEEGHRETCRYCGGDFESAAD